jgi:hypothetical protein
MTKGAIPEGDAFVERWNALDRRDRLRMRRLVRIGRPMDDRSEAELAVAYARFQASRPWARMFWIWFVPGLVLALAAAGAIHPVLIGVVLALAMQALFARRNLRRAEAVNAALLEQPIPCNRRS